MTQELVTFAPSPDRLQQLAWGYAPMIIIHAAVRHGLFDRLEAGPRSLPNLAAEMGVSARGLRALLNALVGLQLLARKEANYTLTPESAAYLVSSQPGYRGAFFHHHHDQLLPQWMQLTEVVRTGRPAATTNRERDGAEHFAGFVESLFPGNYAAATALGEHLGVPGATGPLHVLDIGAGSGVWGIALAKQSPHVRVRAVDWPRVLEVTRRVAIRHGVADRLTPVPGDFFAADFGDGHRVATLGHILHSEGPERIRRLLAKTWQALLPGGVIAIQEFVPNDDRQEPLQPLLFAVNMLVNTQEGDTYTFSEISTWLAETGFVHPRRLDVCSISPLILADKPPAGAPGPNSILGG